MDSSKVDRPLSGQFGAFYLSQRQSPISKCLVAAGWWLAAPCVVQYCKSMSGTTSVKQTTLAKVSNTVGPASCSLKAVRWKPIAIYLRWPCFVGPQGQYVLLDVAAVESCMVKETHNPDSGSNAFCFLPRVRRKWCHPWCNQKGKAVGCEQHMHVGQAWSFAGEHGWFSEMLAATDLFNVSESGDCPSTLRCLLFLALAQDPCPCWFNVVTVFQLTFVSCCSRL